MAVKNYSSGGNSPLHPKQDEYWNKMDSLASKFFCNPYEVKFILSKRLALDYCKNFKQTIDYKNAKAKGLQNKLMQYVYENALVQADAIINHNHPSFDKNGNTIASGFGYSWQAAPHIKYSDKADMLKFLGVCRKCAVDANNIQVPLYPEIKKAITLFKLDICTHELYEV